MVYFTLAESVRLKLTGQRNAHGKYAAPDIEIRHAHFLTTNLKLYSVGGQGLSASAVLNPSGHTLRVREPLRGKGVPPYSTKPPKV